MTNTPRARKMIARVARSSGSRSSRLIHTSQESEEPGGEPPGSSRGATNLCGTTSRENIFEPLFTTKTRAAGLGLSIVKRVVEEHGGSVNMNSQPEKGASFTITLPNESSRGEQRATPSRARRRRKHGR